MTNEVPPQHVQNYAEQTAQYQPAPQQEVLPPNMPDPAAAPQQAPVYQQAAPQQAPQQYADPNQYPPGAAPQAQQPPVYQQAAAPVPPVAPQYQQQPQAPQNVQQVAPGGFNNPHAAGYTGAPAGLTPVAAGQNTTPAVNRQAAAAAKPLGFRSSMQNDRMAAGDLFASVKSAGIQIKYEDDDTRAAVNKNKFVHTLVGEIDFSGVQFCRALRFKPNPASDDAEYHRSYSEGFSDKGEDWAALIAKAQNLDHQCRGDYASADYTIVLTEDALDVAGKTVMAQEGEALMMSNSITNHRLFVKMINKALDAGLIKEDPRSDKLVGTVEVELEWYGKTKGTNTWGLTKFKLLELEEENEENADVAPQPKPTRKRRAAAA